MSADAFFTCFADEIMLPSQLQCPRRMESPEIRLAAAVLQQALKDWRILRGHDRVELVRWFHEEPPGPWPFGFVRLCHSLHLDVDQVRARLGVLTSLYAER